MTYTISFEISLCLFSPANRHQKRGLKFNPKDSNGALLDSKLYIIESLITSYNRNRKDKFCPIFSRVPFFRYFSCSVVILQRFDEVSTFQEGFQDYLCHEGEIEAPAQG